jgi:hypothetical protein
MGHHGGQRRTLKIVCLKSKKGSGNSLLEVKESPLEMVCCRSKKGSGIGLLEVKEGLWK